MGFGPFWKNSCDEPAEPGASEGFARDPKNREKRSVNSEEA
jgi:hypothetical protein